MLGVLVTLLSLSIVAFQDDLYDIWGRVPSIVLILLSITISILAAGSTRFRPGNKYIWLRVAAELTKQEIYLYRIRTGTALQGTAQSLRDKKLADQLETINNRFMKQFQSINLYFIVRPYTGIPPKMYGSIGDDDGKSDLTPDEYIDMGPQEHTPLQRNGPLAVVLLMNLGVSPE
jgi:hypothetical protein